MAALTVQQVDACIHPRQRPRFILAFVFALLLTPFVTFFGGIFIGLVPWIIFLVWVSAEVLFAHFTGNAILVSATNYPRIHELTEELKTTLGVDKQVNVFIFEQGMFNAYMTRLFFRRAVFLNSEILETGVSDDEVRWLVGRFIGYWRAQQRSGAAGWMIRMAQRLLIFNFYILPYDRAMVYTGDRLGLAAIGGDISTGVSAMQKLLVGRQLGYSVNPVGMLEQQRRVKGSFFAFLARIGTAFPQTTARYADLVAFAQRQYPEQFQRFEAANPGLPTDIRSLSAERGGVGPLLRALAATVGVLIALTVISLLLEVSTLQIVGGGRLFGAIGNSLFHHEPPPDEPSDLNTSDNLAPSSTDTDTASPDASADTSADAAAAAAAAANAAASQSQTPAASPDQQAPATPDANQAQPADSSSGSQTSTSN